MSKQARKLLDEAGFTDAIISASSDLDEYLIDSLKTQALPSPPGVSVQT